MQLKVALIGLLIGCAAPTALLAFVKRKWAAWCSIAVSLVVLITGAWILDKRFSVVLFVALIPVGCTLLYGQSRLREAERASLSIRR